MENIDRLRRQLTGLGDLRSIVRTMKALSAASIRQYEDAVAAVTDYYRTVEHGLHVVLRDSHDLPAQRRRRMLPSRIIAVVFGSDHGLCGRFNEEITDHALARMNALSENPGQRLVLTVGARAGAGLEHAGQPVAREFAVPGAASRITPMVNELLHELDLLRHQTGIERVHLFHNRHTGGKGYRPGDLVLLPIDLQRFREPAPAPSPSRSLPTFSMDRGELLTHLVRQFLFVSIFRACAESQAGEHAARLAAMQTAERNLDERLEEVTRAYRSVRQNSITAELLDVVSGFETIVSPQ